MFNGVSTNSSSNYLLRLGTSGGVVATGYGSGSNTRASNGTSSAGLVLTRGTSNSYDVSGHIVLCSFGSNIWISSGMLCDNSNNNAGQWCTGSISLGAALTQLVLTTENGTDTFDAGTVNVMWE